MNVAKLEARYRAYIKTLNDEQWNKLPSFLSQEVIHNGKQVGHDGYRALTPPNTHFTIDDVVVQLFDDNRKGKVASRLDITVDNKRLVEHCFYEWAPGPIDDDWVICEVWTVWLDAEKLP